MKTFTIQFCILICALLQGCLPLADDFNYTPTPRNGNMNMSAWQFITQREDFNDFEVLIRASGIDTILYAQTSLKYTYLLLNNNAVSSLLTKKYTPHTIETVGSLTDLQKQDLQKRLKYHIISGYYYGLPGGNIDFNPITVNTLRPDSSSIVLKLNKAQENYGSSVIDSRLGVNSLKPAPGINYLAVTSNLFVTNGVMAVLGDYASYDKFEK